MSLYKYNISYYSTLILEFIYKRSKAESQPACKSNLPRLKEVLQYICFCFLTCHHSFSSPMAHSVGMLGQECFDFNNKAIPHLHDYSLDEIPTIDYSLLFSKDHNERAKSLEHLGNACKDFGFFYVRTSNAHTYPHAFF